MRRRGSLRISNIVVYTVYYETRDLFLSTKSQIYNKEKHKQTKVILLYKSAMDSNIFLFDPSKTKIVHIRVFQAQVASMNLDTGDQ